ncbi:MAG TPA: sulfatase [Candidatus Limnocylindria bacterium]|nr:sulfatase [Candidatus Limnocylindria bacterium]
MRRAAWLAAIVALGMAPSPSLAGCTTSAEARAVLAAAKRAAKCNYRKLKSGPAVECPLVSPPACAGTLVEDAVRLAYGPNDPPASAVDPTAARDQLRCQRQLGRATAVFIGRKLRYLVKGLSAAEAEAKARKQLDRLPDRCLVTVVESNGVVLPAVGAQVAAAVGGPGDSVDPVALTDALVLLLETWVDRVAPVPVPPRPNIVLILTDDQRADTGGADVMPLLHAELVASGVRFPNGFAPNPVCCPSRASILSGQYSHTNGVLQNRVGDPLDPTGSAFAFADDSTLATWLQDAGYRTGLFGKYLNGYRELTDEYAATHGGVHYVPPGWDRWYAIYRGGGGQYGVRFIDETGVEIDSDPGTCINPGPGEQCAAVQAPNCPHSTDHLRDKALAFIDEAVGLGQPFFLYFSTQSPHGPACPAIRHRGLFAGIAPHRPPNYNEGEPGWDDDADKPGWVQQQGPIDAAFLDDFRIRQLESLQSVDEAIQAIMQRLRETGQDRDTIVVFYGDNGFLWGEHRRDAKSCPYEECLKVPFVVRYPRLAPLPRIEPGFVANIDLAPTFAALAGLDPALLTPPVDGADMTRLLDGTAPAWRTDILGEHWGTAPQPGDTTPPIPTFALVRGPQWKYVEYCTGETELYDLTTDPYELENVASANPAVTSMLAVRLRELDPPWPATLPFPCGVTDDDPDE